MPHLLCTQIKENDRMVLGTLISIFTPMLEGLGKADDYNRCYFMLKLPSPFVLDMTSALLTHYNLFGFLQGECQLGCCASTELQRSKPKDNFVHCYLLYLRLGNA
jgi:hypothetical protein